eukprot:5146164-Pleurochrysis_carterae.AAC.3
MQSSNVCMRMLGHPEHFVGDMAECDPCSGKLSASDVHSMANYTRPAHANQSSIKSDRTYP